MEKQCPLCTTRFTSLRCSFIMVVYNCCKSVLLLPKALSVMAEHSLVKMQTAPFLLVYWLMWSCLAFPKFLLQKIRTRVIKRTINEEILLKIGDVSLIVIISGLLFNAGNEKAGKNIHTETLKCLNRFKELYRLFLTVIKKKNKTVVGTMIVLWTRNIYDCTCKRGV